MGEKEVREERGGERLVCSHSLPLPPSPVSHPLTSTQADSGPRGMAAACPRGLYPWGLDPSSSPCPVPILTKILLPNPAQNCQQAVKDYVAMSPSPSTCKGLAISRPVLGRPKRWTWGTHWWNKVNTQSEKRFDLKS